MHDRHGRRARHRRHKARTKAAVWKFWSWATRGRMAQQRANSRRPRCTEPLWFAGGPLHGTVEVHEARTVGRHWHQTYAPPSIESYAPRANWPPPQSPMTVEVITYVEKDRYYVALGPTAGSARQLVGVLMVCEAMATQDHIDHVTAEIRWRGNAMLEQYRRGRMEEEDILRHQRTRR